MRKALVMAILVGVATISGSAMADTAPAASSVATAGEERLAKLLKNRVAEAPVNCLTYSSSRDVQIIDRTALVYGSGNVIYVNRPRNAQDLRRGDILVTDLRGPGQLCSIDTVRLHDQTGFWYKGFLSLGEFVPYRRVK